MGADAAPEHGPAAWPTDAASAEHQRAAVEHIIRAVLGCTCPPEVLERIQEDPLSLPGMARPGRRIAVGGRLLVYLIEVEDPAQAGANLAAWVSTGLTERDEAGMNRLRLALVTAQPETLDPLLRARWGLLTERDDRTHLHVLSPAAAVAVLADPTQQGHRNQADTSP